MELLYIWIDKYRNFQEGSEIVLSNRFHISYDPENFTITIEENKDFYNIYPDNILNISAVVGKNGSGKTNLAELIGMRMESRKHGNEEIEYVHKKKQPENEDGIVTYTYPDDLEKVNKNASYFFVYHVGKDDAGNHQFCFEGNNIEEYSKLISNEEKVDKKYFKSKYWFSIVCKSHSKKFEYVADSNRLLFKMDQSTRSLQNISSICLFKEKFEHKRYNFHSFESRDEPKIMIPRRMTKLEPDFMKMKVSFLLKQLKSDKRLLYKNDLYKLYINWEQDRTYALNTFMNLIRLKDILNKMNPFKEAEINMITLLYDICYYYLSESIRVDFNNTSQLRTLDDQYNEKYKKINKLTSEIHIEHYNYYGIKDYLFNYLQVVINNDSFKIDLEIKGLILKNCKKLFEYVENLFVNEIPLEHFILSSKGIEIVLDNQTDEKTVLEILKLSVDEKVKHVIDQNYFSTFNNFFSVDFDGFSDGEKYYLGMRASIDEQIKLKTQIEGLVENKQNYILVLDEPETRLHPELARNFIEELMVSLSQYRDKTFQVILASHSPFLIGDIPKENVIMLERIDEKSVVKKSEHQTFSQNIHTLLEDAFFMDATIGEYSRRQIREVNKMLNDAAEDKNMDFGYKLYQAEKLIAMIGEEVTKSMMLEKLESIKKKYQSSALLKVIDEYNQLTAEDKEELIKHIISSSSDGDR